MFTHSLTHTCSHTYTHSYSHIHTHTHTHLHALIHIYTHTLSYTHTHLHSLSHTHTFSNTLTHAYTFIHPHIYKHIYKYSLLRPLRVVHMCFEVHLLLFVNLSGNSSQEKTDSFTLSNYQLPVVFLWVKPCEIFPVRGGMSTGDINF